MSKALYLLIVVVAFLTVACVVWLFAQALAINPENPWEAFPISAFFLGARDYMLVIGGIIWVAGTIIFVLELLGYTVTMGGLKKTKFGIANWSVVDIALIALSAAVYGGLLFATAPIVLVPGFTWLRPANSLAPLFGMFFGIPGCLGVAFGNLIADILGGFFGVGSFGGFIGNFLIAYLPYKFVRDHTFTTTRSIGEFYLWGVLAQAIVSAVNICWWLDIMQAAVGLPIFVIWGIIAPIIFSNNVVVTALLSPILGRALFPLIKARGLYWKMRVPSE